MATENSTLRNPTLATDLDSITAQLAALRADMSNLAASVTGTASRRGQAMAHDVQAGVAEAGRYLGRKGHQVDVQLEKAVSDNPYIALGIAAALGLVLGAMTRR